MHERTARRVPCPIPRDVPAAVAAGMIMLAAAAPARAQCGETQFLNYTGAGSVVCPCFVAGEEAGAVFTLPAAVYPVEILKVGIGWGSIQGGSGASLEEAIHIYAGGLPNPGTPIFTLPGPQLVDGAINEFDLAPLPGDIVIASGPFTVTLEFFNTNAGDFYAPSVVSDGNGCQSGKNVIFAIPGGWLNACSAGVTGDWVFYVKYRSLKVTGAANPVQTAFSGVPAFQTTCDTVHVVNTGCGTLTIDGITGCGTAPFSIDTTLAAHSIPPGGSTPIVVCVTPTSATNANCTINVASNASNGPIVFDVSLDAVTAAGPPAADGFAITGVVPNPFNPATSVRFTLPRQLSVSADVFAVSGARVTTLMENETFPAGENEVRWDGRDARGRRVASGVYLFRLTTPLGQRTARLVLLE